MTREAECVMEALDRQLHTSGQPPQTLYVTQKQHAAVVLSRTQRSSSPTPPLHELRFTQHRGFPVKIYGEHHAS
jgi:hypothetical protein